MSEPVFQILQGGEAYGKKIYASGSGIMEGILCKYTSGSQVEYCTEAATPLGFARGLRTNVYAPTSRYYSDGEAIALTRGSGVLAASSDFFVGGTMPAANALVYAGATGLMTTTAGSNVTIGKCIRQETRIEGTGGTGTSQTVAVVWFNIEPVMA